jgi:hypothetical protein
MNNNTQASAQTTEKKAGRGRPAGKGNKAPTLRIPLGVLLANNTATHLVPVEREYLMNLLGLTEVELEAYAAKFKPVLTVAPTVAPEAPVLASKPMDEPEVDFDEEEEFEVVEADVEEEPVPATVPEDFEPMALERRMPNPSDD